MTKKEAHNPGDVVWIEHLMMPRKAKLCFVRKRIKGEGEPYLEYVFRHAGREVVKRDSEIFKTEKQLLKSKE